MRTHTRDVHKWLLHKSKKACHYGDVYQHPNVENPKDLRDIGIQSEDRDKVKMGLCSLWMCDRIEDLQKKVDKEKQARRTLEDKLGKARARLPP